jgi:RNA recognition motif-containing protein
MSHQPRNSKVFIGDLTPSCSKADVKTAFAVHGIEVHTSKIKIMRTSAMKSLCYGFVKFSSAEEASKAIELTSIKCAGRTMRIAKSEYNKPKEHIDAIINSIHVQFHSITPVSKQLMEVFNSNIFILNKKYQRNIIKLKKSI